MLKLNIHNISFFQYFRPVVAQGYKSVTVNATGCGFNLRSRKLNIYLFFYFFALEPKQRAVLNSAIQHAMPP